MEGQLAMTDSATTLRIAIGSKNPVKIAAGEATLAPLYPGASFVHVEVPSGVRAQPWGETETRTGAINRARAALSAADADLGLGFEGGVVENELGLFVCAWVAIASRDGRLGVGGSTNMQLPTAVAALVRGGLELGVAMDQLFATKNLRHREGAVGTFTDGLVTRQESFEFLVRLALAPFRTPSWYAAS
jgi:inosine/xanthosine triphosphatase